MPSTLTRRRLLGGLAVGGAVSYSGYRFLPANLVPAPVLEERTKRRSVPNVDTALPVAPDAVADSRDHLRDLLDRGESAWDDVDDSDVEGDREEFDRGLESSLDVGREQLAESEGADPTTETLRKLRYGVNRAAWSLAAARAISEDYDPETLRERSNALQSRVNDFENGLSYEVADPRRGLAYLYRAERALHFARLKADNAPGGDSGEGDGDSNERELDHREVVEAVRSEIEGKRWLGDAQAIYDSHRSNVADAGTTSDLDAHLDRTRREFAERIDDLLPDRETAIERYFPDDASGEEEGENGTGEDEESDNGGAGDEEGPREWATRELFNNGYSAADDAPSPSFESYSGLLAFVAVEHAKAFQHALGFTAAMERLDAAFSDGGGDGGDGGGVTMALAARTKREAIAQLRDLLADADDPVTRELSARPREEITIGDWSLGVNRTFESEHPYAEAYAMYVLAAENLSYTAEVRDLLVP